MARGEPLIRQWNLLKALQAHRFGIGVEELANRLECSKRQVQRDLNVLQQVGFPVSFEERDFSKRFWKLSPMFIERQELVLSVTEMLSLFLSRQVLSPLTGTQFGDGLASALDKIKALLPARALAYFDGLDENLLVKSVARHDYSGQDKEISIINQAMNDGRVLRIRYRSASKGKVIDARFHPYGLVFFGMNLYCIGHLEEYAEVRTLKVVRFQGVEMTTDRFEKPPTFSLRAYTAGAFGVFGPGKFQTIKVRFTGWAATNVREHQWHPSQKILKDGGLGGDGTGALLASFELSDTTEFKRWLLGFAQHAVVVSPPSFAAEVLQDLQTALVGYEKVCPQYEAAPAGS
jgi:predicted DNA-binding transcriptional regulator YafY